MRLRALFTCPAALLAAGLATATVAIAAVAGMTPTAAAPHPARTTTIAAPTATADTVATFNDGFTDGRSDAIGDDNRNNRVEPGETGWSCRTTPAADLDLCLQVAAQPSYSWRAPSGATIGNPNGRALIADLEVKPGTPLWTDTLRALHADYTAHTR
ncbi:hypothetical protein EV284_6398 [Streptomyces sp. BK022]|uniref:hypothetical protein n=1 Tax=Streptomyces sp. BK022 TaxID=2512123 RepID=UPI001029C01C|nr:hypothetical protein [Streptomyces sp. BK022]RZU28232.1 hypothetical protein EV284_6398 [Streptomyces sp. BK022]